MQTYMRVKKDLSIDRVLLFDPPHSEIWTLILGIMCVPRDAGKNPAVETYRALPTAKKISVIVLNFSNDYY